jgi:hypothetical protein
VIRAPLPRQAAAAAHPLDGLRLRFDATNALRSWHAKQRRDLGGEDKVSATCFDWTFASEYEGDLTLDGFPVPAERFSPAASEGIPTARLLRQGPEHPILWYDQVELYADDLHDKGEVRALVKARVMGDCLLVLLRCYLRLDRDRVWLRDTRYYAQWDVEPDEDALGAAAASFSDSFVTGRPELPFRALPARLRPESVAFFRDVQVREATMAEVREAMGLPTVDAAAAEALGHGDALQAAADEAEAEAERRRGDHAKAEGKEEEEQKEHVPMLAYFASTPAPAPAPSASLHLALTADEVYKALRPKVQSCMVLS